MLPLMLSVDELAAALGDRETAENLVLVDVGKAERYVAEHLPGAVNITPAETQRGAPVPGLIPEQEQLNRLAQKIGLGPNKHLIVYDDEGGGWAGRFIWILDEIGHRHYSYLDGGLPAWKEAGQATESGEVEALEAPDMQIFASGACTISGDTLMNSLSDHTYLVLDARSPGEYSGEKINAARGGHIPGAVNYNWTKAMDTENALRLRPLDEISQELKSLGLDGSKTVVTHCQSHHRSGLTYLICKLMGLPVLAYAGSWAEWGNRQDTPIDQGSAS